MLNIAIYSSKQNGTIIYENEVGTFTSTHFNHRSKFTYLHLKMKTWYKQIPY